MKVRFRDKFHMLLWQRYLQGPLRRRYVRRYKFPDMNSAERYARRDMRDQQRRCHRNGTAVSRHLFSDALEAQGELIEA